MADAVKEGDQVTIHYTGKLTDETVFDSSEGREPLGFTAGSEEIIPGVSNAVIGMAPGEKKTVEIEPDQAYGQPREDLVVKVPTEKLPEEAKEGDMLSDGQNPVTWVVRERGDQESVLDANHPLAGKTLVFDIELVNKGDGA